MRPGEFGGRVTHYNASGPKRGRLCSAALGLPCASETSEQAAAPYGSMITGWREVNNEWYFFESSGKLTEVYADVIRRQQEKTQWCWVASAEMVGKYHNPACTLTQTDVVESIVGFDPNWPGFLFMCCQAVKEFGGDNVSDATVWGSALDLNQTIELIDDNLPMIGRLSWSLTSGHLVVISGYDM